MLLGVISDSHDNIYALDKVLGELLDAGVELIIHLGDIISPFTVRRIKERIGTLSLIAVLGNNDGDIALLSNLFGQYDWKLYSGPTIIEAGGRRFLIMHGYDGIELTERIARALLGLGEVNGVLFGHTHRALYEAVNDGILLNPGEVCGYLTGKTSYALLDTHAMKAEIKYL